MDLGAFLPPGAVCSVTLMAPGLQSPPVKGALTVGRGHLFCSAESSFAIGDVLTVRLTVVDFALGADSSLCPAKGAAAEIIIAAEVRGCRPGPAPATWALKLKPLGRVLDGA